MPAKPQPNTHAAVMALRVAMDNQAKHDEFASAAMAGLLSRPGTHDPIEIAKLSFQYADAMMRYRANLPATKIVADSLQKMAVAA